MIIKAFHGSGLFFLCTLVNSDFLTYFWEYREASAMKWVKDISDKFMQNVDIYACFITQYAFV